MKKLISLVVVVFVVMGVYGQTKDSVSHDRKYVVKYMAANYVFNSYSFEIERMLNGKNALTLGFGFPASRSIMGKYGIVEDPEHLTDATFSSSHIRVAYRHYAGKSMLPKGFYVEPYLKYQQVKADATTHIDNDGVSSPADLKADLHSFNAGFQMGAQFLIAKRVAIDFYFLGLEGGFLSGNLTGTPNDPSNIDNMRQEIEDGINDSPGFIKNKVTVTNNSTSVIVKASNVPYPWLRGGINIGIAF
jgi:hypothetical protein